MRIFRVQNVHFIMNTVVVLIGVIMDCSVNLSIASVFLTVAFYRLFCLFWQENGLDIW